MHLKSFYTVTTATTMNVVIMNNLLCQMWWDFDVAGLLSDSWNCQLIIDNCTAHASSDDCISVTSALF